MSATAPTIARPGIGKAHVAHARCAACDHLTAPCGARLKPRSQIAGTIAPDRDHCVVCLHLLRGGYRCPCGNGMGR